MPTQHLRFGPFSVEATPPQLTRGTERITLRPKSLAVLRYLAERPGQLVSKEELLKDIWSGRVVGQDGLRTCVREIRAALGDRADMPQYLETVAGQGYRFLEGRDGRAPSPDATMLVVGRESELHQLSDYLRLASAGQRQFVLISGEPGIGKTTLLERLLDSVSAQGSARIARGQCVAQYGKEEAYGPLLEVLTRLCQGPNAAEIVAALRRYAPMWLLQLPGLVDPGDLERIRQQIGGATPERMKRELCNTIAVLAAEIPLVLVLEDLHWADLSTIDFLAALAQRPESARLLLLGTYRPADAVLYAPHLRGMVRDLSAQRQCRELLLELMSARDVTTYLRSRLGGEVADSLASGVFQRCNGNPLFMVNLIEDLMQRQLLVWDENRWTTSTRRLSLQATPETLRSLISRRLESLSQKDRLVLDSASALGLEFAAVAAAAGLEQNPDELDAICESLASRGQFIDAAGIGQWPDGTLSGHYRFQHPLYVEVLYSEIGEARRVRLHRRIAACIETGYKERISDVAAVLAIQFDKGHEAQRAVHYRKLAAEQALGRYAYPEAIEHLTRGIELIERQPQSPERDRITLDRLMTLGPALIATRGYTTPDVEQTYARAQALCKGLGDPCYDFPVMWGLAAFHMVRGKLEQTDQFVKRLLALAEKSNDPDMDLMAHDALAQQLLLTGEIGAAQAHAEQVFTRYDIEKHRELAARYGEEDPGVTCGVFDALSLWLLGFPNRSIERLHSVLALAHELGNPHSTGLTMVFACFTLQLRGEPQATQALADDLVQLAAEHGLRHWQGLGKLLQGWAQVQQGETGIDLARRGLRTWRETGARLLVPFCLGILAQTSRTQGDTSAALGCVVEAKRLIEQTQERWFEAELYRLEGELLLDQDNQQSEAEDCFEHALALARGQRAKSLELRAAISLSRLWRRQRRGEDARKLLLPVYRWFNKELDSEDLRDAKALLDELRAA